MIEIPKIDKDFFTDNFLVMNYDEFLLSQKKKFWKKAYKKSVNKIGVIDSFCASFAHSSEEVGRRAGVAPEKIVDIFRIAEKMSNDFTLFEISEGWTLHRDWFKCMIIQLMNGRDVTEEESSFMWERSRLLFEELGWGNAESYINPVYCDITSIQEVPYIYKRENGESLQKTYKCLVEPTSPIPTGSEWVSKSGVVWKAGFISESGETIDFESIQYEDGSAVKYMIRHFTPKQVYGMKRVK